MAKKKPGTMKPEKILVKDLDDKVGPHSIRLKVIDKGNTQISPKKKFFNFQRIVFQDEEGGIIKTILYNDDIGAYENIIQNKVEYDISNAKIRPMPEKYPVGPDDHPFHLSFSADTIVRAVEGSKPPLGPEYIAIAAIPRTVSADDIYDIVGILIYVEPLRQVTRPIGLHLDIREWVIMDHSTEQPLIVTAWAELATREGIQLEELAQSFPVIGFTSIKPSHHKGVKDTFSSNSTGCHYNEKPTPKKASDTQQEERHWLHVLSPEFDQKDVYLYLGCGHCGTGSKKDINVKYNCTTCKREDVTSVPRMNITFEAIDATGSYMFTALTTDAEKLMQKKATDMYTMNLEERQKYLAGAETRIRESKFYIQVGPTTSLSRNVVLKWVLKQHSLD
ncbi:replication protein A 70 kDa DNA-binding subunit B-like [Silene latifolia]|uniref:replication protein A 70 kDa DNA-binding subunit B-like n=1 Tax=Silene latifolia TaxID=37657 RepID=UPI003D77D7E7